MIIGLCGHMGTGKTTITNAATRWNDGYKFKRMGFADPLYSMLFAMGLETVHDKSTWNQKQELLGGHTIRFACRTLGTEWGRTFFGEDVWAKMAVAKALKSNHHVIIDNVRYQSEFDEITRAGGKIIHFKSEPEVSIDLSHSSEQHIATLASQCNYTFINDRTKGINHNSLNFLKLLLEIVNEEQ